ncbi:MAG: class I SAM-dependent methyltransferase [Blastocatellales bacterium]
MNADNAAKWREALLLPGENDLVESGLRELSEYSGISREEARRACENAIAESKREWESAPRRTHDQIVDFYRRTRSYLFEHIWWHVADVETNAANVELLNHALRRGAREYLDFGSGVGSNAILFAKHGFSVTLADVSETMLDFARWRLERRGLAANFINLNQQPLPRDQFDFVTAVDVCEHLSEPEAAINRIAQSLKAGGAFVFNYHVGEDEDRPMHILMTSAPLFRSLRLNGLREVVTEVMLLRRLEFCVAERGAQSRIGDWFYSAYDRLRYSGLFVNGANGSQTDNQARHPQRIYFDRIKQRLEGQRLDGKTRWLDVGCGRQLAPWWMKGQAEIEADLKSRAQSVIGIDPDLAALGDNRSLALRVNADAGSLPFADGSFDLVTSNMVFEHVETPLESLKEIRRVLRDGGRLIVLTPNWLDIVTIAARIVPNRWHPAVVSRMEERGEADVYPTHFRFNRPATIEKVLREAGFKKWSVESLEHPDVYSHVPFVARVEAAWHKLARNRPALRGALLIEAQ